MAAWWKGYFIGITRGRSWLKVLSSEQGGETGRGDDGCECVG